MAGSGNLTLNDVCDAIVDCEHKTAPTEPTGVPSVRTSNIKNGVIDLAGCNRVSEETYLAWTRRREPRPGDIILAREAPVGEVGIIPKGRRACLGQRTVLVSPTRSKVEPAYLCYLLVTDAMKHEMISRAEGSTVPHLNMSDIRGLSLPPLPSLPEQKAIAHILGTLDDKIELNRRMNETLESMARALFKSWFVDFDPVRAKMDGRQPRGLSAEVAALFPDKLVHVDGELVPEGWTKSSIREHVELQRGTTYKSKLKDQPGPFLLGLGSIERNGGFRSDKLRTYGGESPEHMLLRPGDLYVSLKDVTQSADLLGAVARVPSSVPLGRLTQDTVKLVFIGGDGVSTILYRALLTPEYRAYCKAHATGTTNLGLSRDDFLSYPILLPSPPLNKIFTEAVTDLDLKSQQNVKEAQILASFRDFLLPKLLSGDLRL